MRCVNSVYQSFSHSMQVQNAVKDERLTAMLQQLHERDAEINRLRRELAVWTKLVRSLLLSHNNYCDVFYVQEETVSKDESVATMQTPPQQPHVS